MEYDGMAEERNVDDDMAKKANDSYWNDDMMMMVTEEY